MHFLVSWIAMGLRWDCELQVYIWFGPVYEKIGTHPFPGPLVVVCLTSHCHLLPGLELALELIEVHSQVSQARIARELHVLKKSSG